MHWPFDAAAKSVNGRSIAGLPAEDAAAQISGPIGAPVNLALAAGSATRTVRLSRARVFDPSVAIRTLSLLGTHVLDIRVTRFAAG